MGSADQIPRERTVWIVNPYGTVPGEAWATYRSTMLAECLADHGYHVTQFISSFEHRSKRSRASGPTTIQVRPGYQIEVVPAPAYAGHVSLRRIRYERTFGRNVVRLTEGRPRPAFVVLAEPALFYYDRVVGPLLRGGHTELVLDLIDIWPELFEMVFPRVLRPLSGIVLAPLYAWRGRLYRRARAVVAVSRDYAELAGRITRPGTEIAVVYWGYADERRDSTPVGADVRNLVASKRVDEVWAVYAGTLGENYDIRALARVASRFQQARPPANVRLVVCGDGPLAEFCRQHAGDRLVFLGRLPPSDLAHLYQHCDIGLCTYKGESTVAMPIKVFDYLRASLPIVNSLGRDIGRLVEERGIGLNYDPADPDALYRAIDALASDPERRRVMSLHAQALGREFAAERQYPKFVNLLKRISRS